MSDLPIFSAQGKTDSEKLAELIKFMPSLSSAIDRQMSSLDFNNLNENLRKRIEDSVTEHQDLSEYATRAHTFARYASAKSYAENEAYNAQVNAQSYADTGDATTLDAAKSYANSCANDAESRAKAHTNTQINSLREELKKWAKDNFAAK